MLFTIVTISFNQKEFLERTILSVLDQKGVNFEYIIVDPGSTDGSLEIIERYRDRFVRIIDHDCGPADALNRGFFGAKGDVFCYLNSDDRFCEGALLKVKNFFEARSDVDVVCGHAYVTDDHDRRLRRVWSDPYHPKSQAYGCSIQIQPSTFFRREVFQSSGGFNIANRSNWDGELLCDMARNGARIGIVNEFLSEYRVYETSITGSGKLHGLIQDYQKRRFRKLMGREWRRYDNLLRLYWFARRQIRNPQAMLERLKFGPVYRKST